MINDKKFTLPKFNNTSKEIKKKLLIYFSSKKQNKEIKNLIKNIK